MCEVRQKRSASYSYPRTEGRTSEGSALHRLSSPHGSRFLQRAHVLEQSRSIWTGNRKGSEVHGPLSSDWRRRQARRRMFSLRKMLKYDDIVVTDLFMY